MQMTHEPSIGKCGWPPKLTSVVVSAFKLYTRLIHRVTGRINH